MARNDPPSSTPGGAPRSPALPTHLLEELQANEVLFRSQSKTVQRFLDAQAGQVADGLLGRSSQIRFAFPDQLVVDPSSGASGQVPPDLRNESIGGFVDRVTRADIRVVTRQRLVELEQSSEAAISAAARLTRFATVHHMIHVRLPAGKKVYYRAGEGELIPAIPEADVLEPDSAITARTDAIAEEGDDTAGRGELLVPYVPAARPFFLPQWVAFDDRDQLLVGSLQEAEAHVASMQKYLGVLHAAVSLAPYIVADPEYQRKRYGILGQLVNQGRALARYQTVEIIQTIHRRAAASDLNRGLSLSLPYFDDQALELRSRDFEVIPAGRIMFVPAFVVRAAEDEAAKVAQDTRLDPATRKHLLQELEILRQAFDTASRTR
jgi:hypothetical protein